MKTINAGSSVLIVCCREKVDANEKNSALKIEKQSTCNNSSIINNNTINIRM